MSKPIGEETAAPIPYANIDGRRVAVLHGRVAKTPDGRIHEVVTPAAMMRGVAPVTKCTGGSVVLRETYPAVHNEASVRQDAHNAAKLREALEAVLDECCHHLCGIPDQLAEGGQTCDWRCVAAGRCEAIDKAKAALAAPPRNCDVGSAEEQAKRFFAFCHAHRTFYTACSDDCPFKTAPDINHCQSGWGQLPYEEAAQEGDRT